MFPGLVKQTPNSIGYVELIYAVQNKMRYGKVQNAAGKFIKADLASVSAAAAGAAKTMPDDFRVSITNAPGATAYPISSFTWLLIPVQIQDAAKREAIKRIPEVDDHRRAGLSGSAVLRPASQGRASQRNKGDFATYTRMSGATTAIGRVQPRQPGSRNLSAALRSGDEIAHLITLIFAR